MKNPVDCNVLLCLGAVTEAEMWNSITFDLDRVDSFYRSGDNDKLTRIVMASGDDFTIDVTYENVKAKIYAR